MIRRYNKRPGKTLLLVRHAHRDKSQGRSLDNGLSEKGRAQARSFRKYFRAQFPKSTPVLLSSPKRRCIETLEPIAKMSGVGIKVDPRLDEQRESDNGFRLRVRRYCNRLKARKDSLLVLCSHGDWIPLAIEELTALSVQLPKGAWVEIPIRAGSLKKISIHLPSS